MNRPNSSTTSPINIHKVSSYDQWVNLYGDSSNGIGENDLVIIPPEQIQKKLNPLETGTLPMKQVSILEELPDNFNSTYDGYLITAKVLKDYINEIISPST